MTAVFCACVQAKNFALHESTYMCLSLEWLSPLLFFFFFIIITARGVVNADTQECRVECVNVFPAVRQEEQLCFVFSLSPVSEEARSE